VVYTLHQNQIYQSPWHLSGPQLYRLQKAVRHLESQERCAIRERRTKTETSALSHHQNGAKSCRTHRINVGPSPRVNALIPSVFHTVRTQCNVDRYFCPSDEENPSVCIRDLIISMGYITPQSFFGARQIRHLPFIFTKKINSQHSPPPRHTRSRYPGLSHLSECPLAPSRVALVSHTPKSMRRTPLLRVVK
jgi:hypothetical protein